MPDPPAIADRREVRRLPADRAAGTRLTESRDLSDARTWLIRLAGPFMGGMDGHAEELRAGMRQTLTRIKAAAEDV